MVFQAVLAAHHTLAQAKSLGAGASAPAHGHLQQLDGAGSGCGPTGNNCSGSASAPAGAISNHMATPSSQGKYPIAAPSHGKAIQSTPAPRHQGFFGANAPIPGNHNYSTVASRHGSEQSVHYLRGSEAHGYVGWGNMSGRYGGVFNVHGSSSGSSASAMIAKNPSVSIPHTARHHAFGNEGSNAYSLYPHHHSTGYFGHKQSMSYNKPNAERHLLPEQVVEPSRHIPENLGAEAKWVSGLHSKNLMIAGKLEHAGVSHSTTVHFIQDKSAMYSHHPHPGNRYGVAYATQTQRLPNSSNMSSERSSLHNINQSLKRHNNSTTAGSAYAMTAAQSAHGSRILDRPYHPASVDFCDAYPDRCFFGPAPETQDMGGGAPGGYHSI